MRRREVFGLAGAALAMPRLAHAQADQVLRFVPQADLAVLDPLATTTYVTRDHGFLIFDTLYGIDDTFDPQPQMLEGHVIEQDGLLWRMTLREGLRFHDGTPVLARDAVASIRRWLQRDAFGLDLTPIIDEISAPTDRELRFRLKQPFPLLPAVLGKANSNMLGIMPERLALTDPLRQVTEMIGSGPFRYLPGERVSGSRNIYERFEGYVPRPTGTPSFLAGPKIPHLQRVEWRTMPDPGTASAALQAGEVDWWAQPIPDLVARLRTNRNIRTEILDAEGYLALIRFNHLHPPFDNPALRRALLLAIDQSDVMTAAAGEDRSMWRAGIGYFTPGPMANDAGMSVLQGPRDLAKAREAVQASGYRGERIVFMAPTDYYSINAMSEVVADTLRRIGLNIDYQGMDWGTMVQRWNSRQPLENGGWSAFVTTTSAIGCITPLEHRSLRGTGLRGPQGWPTNPKFEELRDEFLATTDTSRQRTICAEMQEEGFRHVPYLPLGVFYQPTAWRRNVTGQLPGFNRFWNVPENLGTHAMRDRKMHMMAYLKTGPTATHPGGWRHPETDLKTFTFERYEHIARVLEDGFFDGCFYADTLGIPDIYKESFGTYVEYGGQLSYLDPLTILPIMARVTKHLGLGATLSTTFHQPYHLARALGSLDLLSNGRACWNIVTSTTDFEAKNFGMEKIPAKDDRYERGDEFVEACCALWNCWEEDALVMDKASGQFGHADKVRYANYEGKYVSTRGPMTMPRSPQGRPVLMQAGSSPRGREFAGRWAEAIFCNMASIPAAQEFYADIKGRMAKHGREPWQCAILPAMTVVVGETESIAQEKADYLNSLIRRSSRWPRLPRCWAPISARRRPRKNSSRRAASRAMAV